MTYRNTQNPYLVNVALRALGGAIRDLGRPTGTVRETGPYGSESRFEYSTQSPAERLEVTEDLIGAAFVLAQTYIRIAKKPNSPTVANVLHVANYWKHRDTWDTNWMPGRMKMEKDTISGVRALGAAPPVTLGQLTKLAETVLDGGFDVEMLWAKIS